MFAGNYAPEAWAFCDGSMLSVNTYTALFSVIGTKYGGDGVSTFALPDLRGRIPLGVGTGLNLTPRLLGNSGGTETVTLTTAELPAHTHPFSASTAAGTTLTPGNNLLANVSAVTLPNPNPGPPPTLPLQIYQDPPTASLAPLSATAITSQGSSGPHANLMPSFCVSFIIATVGLYPQPS